MSAFSAITDFFSGVNWDKARSKTQEAIAQHSPTDKRGWVTTTANIGGALAGVIAEGFTWEIPVVDLIAPIVIGAGTRFALTKLGNMVADHLEKRAETEKQPARPVAAKPVAYNNRLALQTA